MQYETRRALRLAEKFGGITSGESLSRNSRWHEQKPVAPCLAQFQNGNVALHAPPSLPPPARRHWMNATFGRMGTCSSFFPKRTHRRHAEFSLKCVAGSFDC